jgi:hypothetical protein
MHAKTLIGWINSRVQQEFWGQESFVFVGKGVVCITDPRSGFGKDYTQKILVIQVNVFLVKSLAESNSH